MGRLHLVAAFVIGVACLTACHQPMTVTLPHAESSSLHNIHRLNEHIISGAGPYGPAAFDQLRDMGVRTIISVDGGTPDVKLAESRGMRYVHIPVTYATITDSQRLEIARAIRDLPGPVYLHCHHGKHRGPAAVAAAAIALGMISPGEATSFMQRAGTAESYTGLYACVAAASVASPGELDEAPAEFPSVRKAQGIVAAMVEVDLAFDHLGDIRAAGWRTPANHPDLVPAAEAGRLADNLRISGEDPRSIAKGDEYLRLLMDSVQKATALEEAIVRNRPRTELESRFKLVQASCKDCHVKYRDR